MKANVMSRLTVSATCPRVDFEDDFKSFVNKISEFKKSTYNCSNFPLKENIDLYSIIITTNPL